MSGGTVGTYGVSDISSVGVVPVVQAKSGVTTTFQLVLAPVTKPVTAVGLVPTVTEA